SSTAPRGLRMAAPGSSACPSGSRSFSSPPGPCSSRSVGCSGLPGSKRWISCRASVMGHPDNALERWQGPLDFLSLRLQPRRQLEGGAEFGLRLIPQEPRRVRGHLEQHPARLAEVHRLEVLPIYHGRYLESRRLHRCTHIELARIVSRAEGDVMDRADTTHAAPEAVGSTEGDHAP